MPVSTAEHNPCGWRAWLNNTTITLGMQNVLDEDPPFVNSARDSKKPVPLGSSAITSGVEFPDLARVAGLLAMSTGVFVRRV
jgi:hypothetical protein